MKRSLVVGLVGCLSIGFAQSARATTITFDFEDQSTLSNPMSVPSVVSTVGGLTATLTRQDGNNLQIWNLAVFSGPATWLNRSIGNYDGPYVNPGATLVINFSAPVSMGSIEFGDYNGDEDGPVTLTAFSGLAGTGTSLASSSLLSYPASLDIGGSDSDVRSLSVSAAGILSLTLSSGGDNPGTLNYDNLVVDTAEAAVPEPATLSLLGGGIAALIARRRRSRS